MRDNIATQLMTRKLALRPYRRAHVLKYHDWMADEWLQEMTSSERLTLEEEYEAQQAWIDDPDKCTFLVFDRAALSGVDATGGGAAFVAAGAGAALPCDDALEVGAQVGDVNLFLLPEGGAEEAYGPLGAFEAAAASPEPETGAAGGAAAPTPVAPAAPSPDSYRCAEIMVMIAEPAARRKGFAQEAALALMEYGRTCLRIGRFVAKISEANAASLSLFERKLGFRVAKRVPAFEEVHLVRDVRLPPAQGGGAGVEAGAAVGVAGSEAVRTGDAAAAVLSAADAGSVTAAAGVEWACLPYAAASGE